MFTNALISIDELFDLRTSVWQSLVSVEQFTNMINAGYGVRRTDRWDKYVEYAKYREAYAARDVTTLKNSTITSIIPLLGQTLSDLSGNAHVNPTLKTPVLYVNVPPRYNLSDGEINAICGNLMHAMGLDIPLRVIRYPKPAITPADLRKLEIAVAFVYDVVQWMHDFASNNIITKDMVSPHTTIISSLVHTSDTPFSVKKLEQAGANLKNLLETCVGIQYINAGLYTTPILTEMYHSASGEKLSSSS